MGGRWYVCGEVSGFFLLNQFPPILYKHTWKEIEGKLHKTTLLPEILKTTRFLKKLAKQNIHRIKPRQPNMSKSKPNWIHYAAVRRIRRWKKMDARRQMGDTRPNTSKIPGNQECWDAVVSMGMAGCQTNREQNVWQRSCRATTNHPQNTLWRWGTKEKGVRSKSVCVGT